MPLSMVGKLETLNFAITFDLSDVRRTAGCQHTRAALHLIVVKQNGRFNANNAARGFGRFEPEP